jgi:hypothetical protein
MVQLVQLQRACLATLFKTTLLTFLESPTFQSWAGIMTIEFFVLLDGDNICLLSSSWNATIQQDMMTRRYLQQVSSEKLVWALNLK